MTLLKAEHMASTSKGEGIRCEAAAWPPPVNGANAYLPDGGTEKGGSGRASCIRFGAARERTRWDGRVTCW